MRLKTSCKAFCLLILLGQAPGIAAHPLRLSLSEIEYSSDDRTLTISLRLFLMDVNEALVFDPDSTELAFCQPDEAEHAERMLLEYLNQFFHVKANGRTIGLQIKSKALHGDGDNTALGILFEHPQDEPLRSLEIRNAVFTDLFFDQNNIIYVYVNGDSRSLMLNKKTQVHELTF